MNENPAIWNIGGTLLMGSAVFMLVLAGGPTGWAFIRRYHQRLDRVLNHHLLLGIRPSIAMGMVVATVLVPALFLGIFAESIIFFFLGGAVGLLIPWMIVRHLEQSRKRKLELQLVDGITTLASGVRAGLTLVQSMQVLVDNLTGPIKQEFAQLLREYHLGLDLNHAMRNAANRIGLQSYRLVFTAIEMHRLRGGDTGESLDRIAESVREIQRLEGKLDAITAQGRAQARMMAIMPLVILAILFVILPEDTSLLFTTPYGRLALLAMFGLIAIGFWWIRRIMSVDM
jgi:tight adherence protein B